MSDVYQKSQNMPIPCRTGLVSALRGLEIGESLSVPSAKKSSVHPAAKRAGVRVTVRTLGDGTVRVWRVPAVMSASTLGVFADDKDIFGQPLKKAIFD
jgi:hypothetical protein